MSRPPRPFPVRPVGATRHPLIGPLRYLPREHADFVALQRSLHEGALGRVPADAEGEPTRTLYDLAASVAHVLARYQDFYASEAFLSSAATGRSLVRHARRLAYLPDPGLSASGYAALTINKGQSGTVSAGLGVASAPAGTRQAQDYESTADRLVSADWNEIAVADATTLRTLTNPGSLVLQGVGLGIQPGRPALLASGTAAWPLSITSVVEDKSTGVTTLALAAAPFATSQTLTSWNAANPTAGWRVLYEPAALLRPMGWNADPTMWPPAQLQSTALYDPADEAGLAVGDDPLYGWILSTGGSIATNDLLTVPPVENNLVGTWLLANDGASASAHKVGSAANLTAVLQRTVAFTTFTATAVSSDPADGVTLTPSTDWSRSRLVAPVTRLRLTNAGASVVRSGVPVGLTWQGAWARFAPLVDSDPSGVTADGAVGILLFGDYTALARGMLVALSTLDGATAQVVRLESVSAEAPVAGVARTRITWSAVWPPSGVSFDLGNLVVLGNVVPIAHGVTKTETLGSSDGTTSFQKYTLKKTPMSHETSAGGSVPVITVTVSGVTWARVGDFAESGPTDRHHRVEVDADGTARVIFGDGRQGAIPPAGAKNLIATYRIGLGDEANTEAGAAARLAKAHPLVQRVRNPVALTGGTEPADPEGIRTIAPLYLRTFDRAVSVADHADLALNFPGVYRSAARWDDLEGVQLVAATSTGEALSDSADFLAFVQARRDTSVRLTLKNEALTSVPVFLSLYVELEDGYAMPDVQDALRTALTDADAGGLFTFAARELGQAAHLSEVYEVITAVEGVAYVEATNFSRVSAAAGVADVLLVEAWEWLKADTVTFTTEAP